jgi:DNA-binding winged helix-turn-helix (wHTH) protein/tetratricopeptide (TPR) repeat protein
MQQQSKPGFSFGDFRMDASEGMLYLQDRPVRIPPKVYEMLQMLVEREGKLVSNRDLRRRVWRDTHVGPRSVAQNMFLLRKILAADPNQRVETVPGKGYRFIGEVHICRNEDAALVASKRSLAPANFWSESKAIEIYLRKIVADTGRSRDELQLMGLMDTVASRLSRLAGIQVHLNPATGDCSGLDPRRDEQLYEPCEVGSQRYILTFKLTRWNEHSRIRIQLTAMPSAIVRWAERFDYSDKQNPWIAEDLIANRVSVSLADKLGTSATPEPQWLFSAQSSRQSAHDDCIRGRIHWDRRTRHDLYQAIECFERSLQSDSMYAPAYVGLADCYNVLSFFSDENPNEVFPRAIASAQRALELDPSMVESSVSLGFAKLSFAWNWSGAESTLRHATETLPSYATAWNWYAESLLVNGRTEEALSCILHARKLDPLSVTLDRQQGKMAYRARRYDEACLHLEGAIDRHPLDGYIQSDLGLAYMLSGKMDDAMRALHRAAQLRPEDAAPVSFLAYMYRLMHKISIAKKFEDQLCVLSRTRYVSPYLMAIGHIAIGDDDHAFSSLGEAVSGRASYMMYLNSDPLLDPIRQDYRFEILQNKMNLPKAETTQIRLKETTGGRSRARSISRTAH